MDLRIFFNLWSGIVLAIKKNKDSVEPYYQKNIIQELYQEFLRMILIIILISISTYGFISNEIYRSATMTLTLAVNIMGLYVGSLLLLKQTHIQSKHADAICSLFKQGGCNDVLESSASTFFGVASWSEIGLSYFVSNIILILLAPHLLSYLIILNIFTLPYSVWSVWFQKYRAKQWCPLCLSIQILLWTIFLINRSIGRITEITFNTNNILLCTIIYILPFVAIELIIPLLVESRDSIKVVQEMNSLRMRNEIFLTLLRREKHYEINKNTSKIIFGNKNATNLITILTNPHCNPCAAMHKRVEKVLASYNDKICIQYIFTAFKKELEVSNKFLIAVYYSKKIEDLKKTYKEWYEFGKNDSTHYIKNSLVNLDTEIVELEFKKHQAWLEKTKLQATPTILFNGYEIPNIYEIEDLINFTDLNVDFK